MNLPMPPSEHYHPRAFRTATGQSLWARTRIKMRRICVPWHLLRRVWDVGSEMLDPTFGFPEHWSQASIPTCQRPAIDCVCLRPNSSRIISFFRSILNTRGIIWSCCSFWSYLSPAKTRFQRDRFLIRNAHTRRKEESSNSPSDIIFWNVPHDTFKKKKWKCVREAAQLVLCLFVARPSVLLAPFLTSESLIS